MIIFESALPPDFHEVEIKKILDYVTTGKFCQLVSVPGAGKATILRVLAHNRKLLKHHLGQKEASIRFEYLNLHALESFDELTVAKYILTTISHASPDTNNHVAVVKELKEFVNHLADQKITLVFLLDHFDEYQNKLHRSFFQLLRELTSVAKYKFAVVFATRRDLTELIDEEIQKEFYDFFVGNTVYVSISDEKATTFMVSQLESVFEKKLAPATKQAVIKATSGHAKLTKVVGELVLRGEADVHMENLLDKPIVRATLLEVWLFLTAQEQQALLQINRDTVQDDVILDKITKFGLVRNSSITIPLFDKFIHSSAAQIQSDKITYDENSKEIKKGDSLLSDLLSSQEYRLLKYLIQNAGKIVEREEIIGVVWPDAKVKEGISDEAIDQMIFRLRKKIEDEPNSPKHLVTVKGQGWRFTG